MPHSFESMAFGNGVVFYSCRASFDALREQVVFDQRAGLISERCDPGSVALEAQAQTLLRMKAVGSA